MKTLLQNWIPYSFLLLLFYSFSSSIKAQNLLPALDLNPGGVIYSVIDDPYHNCYIVAGDFTSINGVAKDKFAFINKDLSLNTTITYPQLVLNGEIRAMAFHKDGGQSYVYIGGDFTQVNGNYLGGCFRLKETSSNLFTLDSWGPFDSFVGDGIINDISIFGDTLVIAGDFSEVLVDATVPSFNLSPRPSIAAYEISTDSLLAFPAMSATSSPDAVIYKVDTVKGRKYVAGKRITGASTINSMVRLTSDGSIDNQFAPPFQPIGSIGVLDFELFNDSTIAVIHVTGGNGMAVIDRLCQLTDGQIISNLPLTINGVYRPEMIARSHNHLFGYWASNLTGHDLGTSSLSFSPTINPIDIDQWHNQIFVVDNKLFISAPDLTESDGNSRIGAAVYCLQDSPLVVDSSSVLTLTNPGTEIQWVDCNANFAPIPGANQATFIPTLAGSYAVIVGSAECTDTSSCMVINTVGIASPEPETFAVYPNPTLGKIHIEIPFAYRNGKLSIFDSSGKKLRESVLNDSESVRVEPLKPGIYFVRMEGETGTLSKKIVFQ